MVLEDFGIDINGVAYGDVIGAAIIFVAALVISKITYVLLKRTVGAYAARTKTTLDDEILNALHKPLYFGIIIAGGAFALGNISFLVQFSGTIAGIATILVILIGMSVAAKTVDILIRWYAAELAQKTHSKTGDKFLPIFSKVARISIYFIAFMLVLGELGIQITPLLAGLGIGGLAVALALQPTLSNFFSGTYILTDGSIRIGDYIEVQGMDVRGFVEDIGWRSTKIKTLPNNIVIVPNAKLADSVVTNYYSPDAQMAVVVPVGVSYGSDMDEVEKVTIDVAKKVLAETPGGVKDFEPFVRYNEFGDSNIKFSVILRVQSFVDKYLVQHEFIKQLKKRFDEEGIEIAYPSTNVYFKAPLQK